MVAFAVGTVWDNRNDEYNRIAASVQRRSSDEAASKSEGMAIGRSVDDLDRAGNVAGKLHPQISFAFTLRTVP
jgi:hypothetical protein